MLHCLHCVLWIEFSTWGSSDVLLMTTRPEKNNFALSTECYSISLWANRVFLGKFEPILHIPFFQQMAVESMCQTFSFSIVLVILFWSSCNNSRSLFKYRKGHKINVTGALMVQGRNVDNQIDNLPSPSLLNCIFCIHRCGLSR